MISKEESNYYLSRVDTYWKQLGRLFKSSSRILPTYMEAGVAGNIGDETYVEFKRLLAVLPDIGGDTNMLTFTFVSSVAALAYMRVLEKYGLPLATIGIILNEVYADVYTSLPGLVRWLLRRSEFTKRHRTKLKAYAQESQLRKYPANWVMEYVEGDGIEFDYGCDYTECAVLKFYRVMDAERYMPFVCVMDFTASHILRTGLQRTTSLYYGGPCCDFRYKINRPSPTGLPLEALPEFMNQSS